jgi:uncharacterized membrane protein YdcZ (DUF606 family)
MRNELLVGIGVAIGAGILIGIQSTFLSRGGAVVGGVRSGLLTTLTGAVFSIGLLLIIWQRGETEWQWDMSTWLALTIAGVLGAIIMGGISFASLRAGITATLAALFMGQMLISSFVDANGWSGSGEIIPFTMERLGGLLLLGAGVYFLLFRN